MSKSKSIVELNLSYNFITDGGIAGIIKDSTSEKISRLEKFEFRSNVTKFKGKWL